MEIKKLSLLGSTGSIGKQTLNVVRNLNCGDNFPVEIKVLAAASNVAELEKQIREFKPQAAAVFDENAAKSLKENIRDLNVKVLSGIDGLCEAAAWDSADTVLNSVVGMVGLRPTLAAIEAKKTLALANKETLVAGGSIVMRAARENNVKILPVDSEHSAIFQCLEGCHDKKSLKKLILTASGGPFFGKNINELRDITPKEALNHPTWAMGSKITIDSATMMNKGLEVIEASWLFDIPAGDIDVVIHRESVVHSLIEYRDNSVIAQLGVPDMRIPIQYAMTYPERFVSPVDELNLAKYANLSFFEPDLGTFKCLKIAYEAINAGELKPAAANGANEVAVDLFLNEKISFLDIAELVQGAVENQSATAAKSLSDVLDADKKAREFVLAAI